MSLTQTSLDALISDPSCPGELTELNLPRRAVGADDAAARAEKQFDNLIELLASERSESKRSSQSNRRVLAEEVTDPAAARAASAQDEAIVDQAELSIVMPCHNDGETVGNCILKAMYLLDRLGISGEVIVADLGSRDDSVALALELGARVVHIDEQNNSAALVGGIDAARGRYILVGDATDSYDFSQAERFYNKLLDGADIVQGCRLPAGGGRIMRGAMPMLNRYANPLLSGLARKMFRAPVHDIGCQMQAFTREFYQQRKPNSGSDEFASQMVVQGALFGARVEEVPVTLHVDTRRSRNDQLRKLRDGWQTMQFYAAQSPRWTFAVPALFSGVLGLTGGLVALVASNMLGQVAAVEMLTASILLVLLGLQLGCFALLSKLLGARSGHLPPDRRVQRFVERWSLNRTLAMASLIGSCGYGLLISLAWTTPTTTAGILNIALPAMGAIAAGIQLAANAFVIRLVNRATG